MRQRYVLRNLASRSDVDRFIDRVNVTRHAGGLSVVLDPETVFPNAAVPFAAALSFYRSAGYPVRVVDENDRSQKFRLNSPMRVSAGAMDDLVLTKVWQYGNEVEAMMLCRAYVDALSEHALCPPGLIESLNWCLYEVMDNVFQHSRCASGYAMMQIHPKKKWLSISIADTGIGVHRSFVEGGVHPAADAYAALKLAVQERVTSKTKNMGNGLYGLIRVVGLNGGKLEIQSGRGRLEFKDKKLVGDARFSRPLLELNDHHATSVDWQMDLSRPVFIEEALAISTRSNLRLEDLENEDGQHELRVSDFEEGLGTRKSAENVRLRLQNLLQEGSTRISLNFEGVAIVSSSFADEVLGKLALQMGLLTFMRCFDLTNMSSTVAAIVERAIQQRLEEGDDSLPGVANSSWRPEG